MSTLTSTQAKVRRFTPRRATPCHCKCAGVPYTVFAPQPYHRLAHPRSPHRGAHPVRGRTRTRALRAPGPLLCRHTPVDADPYILEVAKFARAAPLPPGWDEKEDAEGDPLFVNDEAALEQSQHPLDAFFEELIRRRRREFSQGAAPFSRKAFEKVTSLTWRGIDQLQLADEHGVGSGDGARVGNRDPLRDAAFLRSLDQPHPL